MSTIALNSDPSDETTGLSPPGELARRGDGSLSGGLMEVMAPTLVVAPGATPETLASDLIRAARGARPLGQYVLNNWWDSAPMAAKTQLALRLARAIPYFDAETAQRFQEPAWRGILGVALAVATFAVVRRNRERYRAVNTLRAWRNDWLVWRKWCKKNQVPSFNPSALQLKTFFAMYAPTHKLASIRRWGATLTAMHLAAGLPDPFAHPLGQDAWREATTAPNKTKNGQQLAAARAAAGKPVDRRNLPDGQAKSLTRELVDRAIARCATHTPIGARDAALLGVNYDMMSRRSELVALQAEDFHIEPDGTGRALVRHSKTDQAGAGAVLFLRASTATLVRAWLTMARMETGPIFRALRGFTRLGELRTSLPALGAGEVSRIIKRRLTAAGLVNVKGFSGHSARIGAAQDLKARGISDIDIMGAGRWTSLVMVARYTKNQRAGLGGMAKLAKMQDGDDRADDTTP